MPPFDNHPINTLMKHTGSSLRDLGVRAKLDKARKKVHAETDHFDSVLALMFFRSLESDGMLCIEDEHDYNTSRPAPPWEVFLTIAGIQYLCRVVLRPNGETAVCLLPQTPRN